MSQVNQRRMLAELGGVFTFTVSNSNSSVFKIRLKVPRSSADLQLYDSEFQTEGALTQNAFPDNVSSIRSTASNSLSADRRLTYPGDERLS